jgi:nucleotide-binding universal stress UspA family protein
MSQMSASPGVRGGQLRADAQELIEKHTPEGEMLERDIQMLEKPDIHPSPKVRHGLVVDEILAEAHSGDYDLVVVGAHPAGGSQRFLLDNIAHQIMKRINRPILIVKEKETTNPSQ